MRTFSTNLLAVALAFGLALGTASEVSAQSAPAKTSDPFKTGKAVPAGAVAVVGDRSLLIEDFARSVYERYIGREIGGRVLKDLVQRKLILTNMKKMSITVGAAELEQHYSEVDRQYREATKGEKTIADILKQEGLSAADFRERLRLQLALKKMAARDFKREDISTSDQAMWLRSKTLDAKVEQDIRNLPDRAAARVYGEYITFEDFAREILNSVKEREALGIVRTRLEAMHALQMLESAGIEYSEQAKKEAFKRFKTTFEADAKFKNIPFEDFIRERSGMSIEAYQKGPVFTRQAALHLLGRKLVSDEEAPQRYEAMKENWGPRKHVRHIFIRGDRNPKNKEFVRSFDDAKQRCEEILERIRKGDKFDELVRVLSEDVNSKFKGGTLDIFTPVSAREFKALDPVLATMEVGDIKGPIRSSKGYHVIKLESVEPAPALSPAIAEELRKRVAVEAFLKSFRAAPKGVDLRRFMSGTR
jgi:PPIC-type PPIASE domain/SurA-like N-terminal domain